MISLVTWKDLAVIKQKLFKDPMCQSEAICLWLSKIRGMVACWVEKVVLTQKSLFSDIVKRGYLTPLIKKLNKTPIIGDCTQRADFLLFAKEQLGYQTK